MHQSYSFCSENIFTLKNARGRYHPTSLLMYSHEQKSSQERIFSLTKATSATALFNFTILNKNEEQFIIDLYITIWAHLKTTIKAFFGEFNFIFKTMMTSQRLF